MTTSAERLKAVRKAMGLTQAGLAERLGVHTSMVAQLEAGHRTMSLDLAAQYADRLGCPRPELSPELADWPPAPAPSAPAPSEFMPTVIRGKLVREPKAKPAVQAEAKPARVRKVKREVWPMPRPRKAKPEPADWTKTSLILAKLNRNIMSMRRIDALQAAGIRTLGDLQAELYGDIPAGLTHWDWAAIKKAFNAFKAKQDKGA